MSCQENRKTRIPAKRSDSSGVPEPEPAGLHRAFLVAGTVLLILACMAAGCSQNTTTAPVSLQPLPGGGSTIIIKNFAFDPPSLTVKTGTAIAWMNQDGAPHTVASDTGAPESFTSRQLASGESYTFRFTLPGTYPYHCQIHPSMTGTVIVEP